MVLLIKEELKPYQDAKVCDICGKRILKFSNDKNYQKVRDHCHYTDTFIHIEAQHLVFII